MKLLEKDRTTKMLGVFYLISVIPSMISGVLYANYPPNHGEGGIHLLYLVPLYLGGVSLLVLSGACFELFTFSAIKDSSGDKVKFYTEHRTAGKLGMWFNLSGVGICLLLSSSAYSALESTVDPLFMLISALIPLFMGLPLFPKPWRSLEVTPGFS